MNDDGVECPVLFADSGKLYSLAGNIGNAQAGDRLRIQGEVAEMSTCMQGTTISVESVEVLP